MTKKNLPTTLAEQFDAQRQAVAVFKDDEVAQMVAALPQMKTLLPMTVSDSKDVMTSDLFELGEWVQAEQKTATAYMLARGLVYKKIQDAKDFNRAELINWLEAEYQISKPRTRESLRAVEFFFGLPEEFRRPVVEMPVRSLNTISKQDPAVISEWLHEDILDLSLSQRKFAKHLQQLTIEHEHAKRIQDENDKLKAKNAALKDELDHMNGRYIKVNPKAFYYRKQAALLVEEVDKVALGFDEVLSELNADPNSAEIWDVAATDLFMSYQGALAKLLTGFERIKSAIPEEFQTSESAAVHAYSEAEIIEMQRLLDLVRSRYTAEKLQRQGKAQSANKPR